MDEHDDDLDSKVEEGAEQEADTYPNTSDELDETVNGTSEEDEDPPIDDDEAEL